MKKVLLLFFSLVPSIIFCANHDHLLKAIQPYLPSNPIILEAGAHKGEDTERMAHFWPEGTIHAFEPSPDSFTELKKRTSPLSNVHRYPFALTDFVGTTPFYISTDNSGASSTLAPADWFTLYTFIKEPIMVKCTSLHDWAFEHSIKHIDFMWLDMEGNELTTLKNDPVLLKTVKVIFIELNNKEFRIGTPHYNTVKQWIEQQGFTSVKETRAYHKDEWWQSDVLFIRLN